MTGQTQPQMTRPLRSTPVTEASSLLRAGPPARLATVLTPPRTHPERPLPLVPARDSVKTRLPMFHARAADQAHAASMPDTTWPVIGHPPGLAPAARDMATVSMPLHFCNDTSTAVRVHSSSWSLPDASWAPFPHRSPRRSSANAACGGLKPPPERATSKGQPSSLAQHRLKEASPTHEDLHSSFMAHASAKSALGP